MRVRIGPYTNWFGPYQLADLLKYVGVKDEDKRHEIGEKLSNTWVGPFLSWVDSKKKRKISVHIDRYDVWSMDNTLAYIVLPMLKMLKETKNGAPYVDDEDVPDALKSTAAGPKLNTWDTDDNYFKRWDYVLDEMIFAFEAQFNDWESKFHSGEIDFVFVPVDTDGNVVDKKDAAFFRMEDGPKNTHSFDKVGHDVYRKRVANGYKLFGKYYQALWD